MNVRQLNEDYLFISLYGIVLGMSFAIKRIYKGEWTVNITNVQVRSAFDHRLQNSYSLFFNLSNPSTWHSN